MNGGLASPVAAGEVARLRAGGGALGNQGRPVGGGACDGTTSPRI